MKTSLVSAMLTAALLLGPATGWSQTSKSEGFVTVQPAGQWLVSQFIGQRVTNNAGEQVGDVNDVLFDKSGQISTVVIGVGGFLGIGEKNVAVPFGSLSITADADGKRVLGLPLSKERLQGAPDFKPTEKTVYMRAKEQAAEMGQKAIDTAKELKDKAAKTIDGMKSEPKNN
jgi:sporulation protein YlmC with PRC-barrel domain